MIWEYVDALTGTWLGFASGDELPTEAQCEQELRNGRRLCYTNGFGKRWGAYCGKQDRMWQQLYGREQA